MMIWQAAFITHVLFTLFTHLWLCDDRGLKYFWLQPLILLVSNFWLFIWPVKLGFWLVFERKQLKPRCAIGLHEWHYTTCFDLALRERSVRTCLRCEAVHMFNRDRGWRKL